MIGGESDVPHFGFSSKTCLDILTSLTIDQLKFKIKYLKIVTTTTTKQGYVIVKAIKSVLQNNLYDDFCNTINSVTDTVSSFSCLVKRAEESVEKLSKLSPPVTHLAPVEPI